MKNWPGLARLARLPGWSCSWLGLCRWQSELDRPLDEQLTTAIAISNQASTGRRAASRVRHSARDMSSSVACIQMQIHSQQQQIQIHSQQQQMQIHVQAAVAVTDTALSLLAVVSVAHAASVFVSVSAALAVSVLSLLDTAQETACLLSLSLPLRPLQAL